ncbi:MAG: ribbon-helix-helix protein, CopG family [Acidobacteria bacterium]|nr:ribbon-helix-helix protein, CopG family [Acidobacteriota bacterium]
MRTRETITISLPPAMLREVERIRKAEHRSRSELLREALRAYFLRRFPEVAPTKAELRALEQGRAAMRKGEYITLDELEDYLELRDPKIRRQIEESNEDIRARRTRPATALLSELRKVKSKKGKGAR